MAIRISQKASENFDLDRQSGSLLHFHQRFGHLAFDTVERIARDPASSIVLKDR